MRTQEAVFDMVHTHTTDSLAEVLLRLPLCEMVRASAVCRRWRAVVRVIQKGAYINAWQDGSCVHVGVPVSRTGGAGARDAMVGARFTASGTTFCATAMDLCFPLHALVYDVSRSVPTHELLAVVDAMLAGDSQPTVPELAKLYPTVGSLCDTAGRTLLLAIADGHAKPGVEMVFAALLDSAERSGMDVAALLNTATASTYTNTWCGKGAPDVVTEGTTVAHLAIRRGKLAIARVALLRGGVIAPRLSPVQMSDIYDAIASR